MSYLDAYINRAPAFGWEGGPEFSTRITDLANGREVREAQWARVRHKYTLPFRNIKGPDYAQIKRMHLACRGRLHGFRYRDPMDHTATDEVFGEGDGATTVFQLSKVSAIAGVEYVRDCFAIVQAQVKVGAAAAAVTLDLRRGKVTFAAPPADGAILSWTGVFDVWVRFDADYLPFTLDNANGKGDKFLNGSVELIELPPPAPGDD